MKDFIKKLRDSDNSLLKAMANDVAKWQHLKHCKEDLELLLTFNIVELIYSDKKGNTCTAICTSNTVLINILKTKTIKDKKKFVETTTSDMHTRDMQSVDTWDMINKHKITIPLKSWQVLNFLSITKENILLLDKIINDILK